MIPFSKTFGIIQWIDKTVQMNQFIFNTKDLHEESLKSRKIYDNWIKITAKHPSNTHKYAHSAEKTTREEAVQFFDRIVGKRDLLRFMNVMKYFCCVFLMVNLKL